MAKKTWELARQSCQMQTQNSDLVSVNNQDEQDFLVDTIKEREYSQTPF